MSSTSDTAANVRAARALLEDARGRLGHATQVHDLATAALARAEIEHEACTAAAERTPDDDRALDNQVRAATKHANAVTAEKRAAAQLGQLRGEVAGHEERVAVAQKAERLAEIEERSSDLVTQAASAGYALVEAIARTSALLDDGDGVLQELARLHAERLALGASSLPPDGLSLAVGIIDGLVSEHATPFDDKQMLTIKHACDRLLLPNTKKEAKENFLTFVAGRLARTGRTPHEAFVKREIEAWRGNLSLQVLQQQREAAHLASVTPVQLGPPVLPPGAQTVGEAGRLALPRSSIVGPRGR